ncbi:MAG TPA: hypothetical protein VIA18_00985 [Polyangia bacterium]|nr:hypothetical protein [Polyangia bacterium]
MRVFASVLVAFVGLGCTGQAPIGAASSEITQSPLCAWQADAPGSGLEIADESDEWQKHTPSFGYLVTTLARDNYQIFAFDQTMTNQIWSLTVMPDALPYYQGLTERIPFEFPATPPPVGTVDPPWPVKSRPQIGPVQAWR